MVSQHKVRSTSLKLLTIYERCANLNSPRRDVRTTGDRCGSTLSRARVVLAASALPQRGNAHQRVEMLGKEMRHGRSCVAGTAQ